MSATTQSYENHAHFYPMWHYVAFPILAVNVIVELVVLARQPGLGTAWDLAVAVALVLTLLTARLMSLKNQDRIIRAEERARLAALGAGALKKDPTEFTTEELIGLRFASDDELVELANRVCDGELTDRKSIKKAVRSWRPDFERV